MSQDIQQTRRLIFDELSKIVDPEIGVSIMELELIDKVDIEEKDVNVDLHLTSPFCPAVFGFKIAQDVRDNIYKIDGIENVKVNVSNHFMAEAINKQVNESKPPSKQQQQQEEEEDNSNRDSEEEEEEEEKTNESKLE
jgi:metal-sulfur cluster biosynthetic enzyme